MKFFAEHPERPQMRRWIPYVAVLLVPFFPLIYASWKLRDLFEWWYDQLVDAMDGYFR